MNIWIVVVGVSIALLILEILQVFVREGTTAAKGMRISKIGCAFALALISGFKTYKYAPPQAPSGELLPRSTAPSVLNGGDGLYYDNVKQTIGFRLPTGTTVQPLGDYVPLSFTRTDRGILVSALVFSLDGKQVAELRDNIWITNPGQYFRLNFDRSAIEIIDNYRTPILQVEYSRPNEIRIGGVFRIETDKTSVLYPQFPSAPANNPYAVITYAALHGGWVALSPGKTSNWSLGAGEQEQLARTLRSLILPWFDYKDPKRLGVRARRKAGHQPNPSQRHVKMMSAAVTPFRPSI